MADRLRAYRLTLNPTRQQCDDLARHAGAARWAYNHALAAKLDGDHTRTLVIDELVTLGWTEKQASKLAPRVPSKTVIQKRWNMLKGDGARGVDGVCPWWRQVSTYAAVV